MQDMTATICNEAEVGATKQLIDRRDSKSYWVAKLKDSNCWMTQNLDLDLSTGKALTSTDSDVTSNWTPTNNTQTTPSGWGTSNTAVKSYSPGQYIYTTPTTQNQCPNSSTGLSGCTSNGWVDVSNLPESKTADFYAATTYIGTDGVELCSKPANSAISSSVYPSCKAYDAHYSAGNYYSYVAATAGTGTSISSGNATSSICPKGWQLPTSNSTTVSKSFGYLLTQYGLASSITAGSYDVRLSPLHFVYGGLIYNSTLSSAGNYGNYWSSTAGASIDAYALGFAAVVTPSSYSNRYYGFSVRCVAR